MVLSRLIDRFLDGTRGRAHMRHNPYRYEDRSYYGHRTYISAGGSSFNESEVTWSNSKYASSADGSQASSFIEKTTPSRHRRNPSPVYYTRQVEATYFPASRHIRSPASHTGKLEVPPVRDTGYDYSPLSTSSGNSTNSATRGSESIRSLASDYAGSLASSYTGKSASSSSRNRNPTACFPAPIHAGGLASSRSDNSVSSSARATKSTTSTKSVSSSTRGTKSTSSSVISEGSTSRDPNDSTTTLHLGSDHLCYSPACPPVSPLTYPETLSSHCQKVPPYIGNISTYTIVRPTEEKPKKKNKKNHSTTSRKKRRSRYTKSQYNDASFLGKAALYLDNGKKTGKYDKNTRLGRFILGK